ncbi:Rcs stress response system protein RcsF [Pseudaeromonas sp. ZJS20]|uniref:Rcs stress response system protein RcsF n=1 Tax=Pseudaeromonas aegiceratis TaxID=3153928 RepID=UPI00390C56BB
MRRLPLALPLSLSLVLLTGCSMFSFHTNIDKENFTEYFKPGTVALVEKAQLEDLNYEVLGTVEAESCQADADQPVPNLGDARTQARRKVADMGGNGLLMGKCVTLEQTADCLSSLLCYGQALKVAEPAQ